MREDFLVSNKHYEGLIAAKLNLADVLVRVDGQQLIANTNADTNAGTVPNPDAVEAGQPAAALREFETALEQTPNRYRTFLGIARAANAAGDRQKASEYYDKLVNLAKHADTERPETKEAKAFLANK